MTKSFVITRKGVFQIVCYYEKGGLSPGSSFMLTLIMESRPLPEMPALECPRDGISLVRSFESGSRPPEEWRRQVFFWCEEAQRFGSIMEVRMTRAHVRNSNSQFLLSQALFSIQLNTQKKLNIIQIVPIMRASKIHRAVSCERFHVSWGSTTAESLGE